MSEKDKIVDLAVQQYRKTLETFIELQGTNPEQFEDEKYYYEKIGEFRNQCDNTPLVAEMMDSDLYQKLEKYGDDDD